MGEHASCKASSQPSQTSGQAESQRSSMWEVNLSLQIPAKVAGPQSSVANSQTCGFEKFVRLAAQRICDWRIRDLQTIFWRIKTFSNSQIHYFFHKSIGLKCFYLDLYLK
jgi:hypothetical protein